MKTTRSTRPQDWIEVQVGPTSALLSAMPGCEIKLVDGCRASVKPGQSDWQSSFYLFPPKGKPSVIAVKIREPFGQRLSGEIGYLLDVTSNGHIQVCLETPHLPDASRMPQITRDGLSVTAGGRTFVAQNLTGLPADNIRAIKTAWWRQGVSVVGKPGMLCDLLAGTATLEQVVEEAKWEPPRQESWQERCAVLTQRNEELAGWLRVQAAQSAAGWQALRQIHKLAASSRLGNRKSLLRKIARQAARALAGEPECTDPAAYI